MHVVHLLDSSSHLAGGIAEAVKGLALALQRQGLDVSVLAGTDAASETDGPGWAPIHVENVASAGLRDGVLGASLRKRLTAKTPDLVHLHGLWGPAARGLASWVRSNDIPYVVSPHGMLDPWALARSSAKKRISASLWEGHLLQGATLVHALAEAEAAAVRAYTTERPIAIVPNGVNCPGGAFTAAASDRKKMLFMARIHPKKGLIELLSAWAMLPTDLRRGWLLEIAGWDEIGILDELRGQAALLGIGDDVIFPGGLQGTAKDTALRGASAFILPSYSEGLPMAVLEGWAYGLPVFMTDACNLPVGFASGAAFRITTDPVQMAEVLRSKLADPAALAEAGSAGRRLAESQFAWQAIAGRMLEHYREAIERK
ncbi:MAG: glycosyltransferase [Pseudomonadota bacterium]